MDKKTDAKPEDAAPSPVPAPTPVVEIGGARRATEPTRFGDWELNGKCVDF